MLKRPMLPLVIALLCSQVLAIDAVNEPKATDPSFDAVRGDRASGWLPQTRSEVLARNGVVATSQPLAAEAGLQVLRQGGNAFDAAVATAAVLNVVEPESAGVGGDMFAIGWVARERKLVALNASGRAPSGATLQHLAARGFTGHMPLHGIDSATVPGAVDGWDELLRRFGTLTFKETLEPAAVLAEQGFAVTERIHDDWIYGATVLSQDPDSIKTYLQDGNPPTTYSVFRNPDLAHTFKVLQSQGRDGFYEGDIAHAMVAKSNALGGTLTLKDLAETRATWETPISTNYHGYDVFEMPPNTQGFAALEMLNILGQEVGLCGPLRVQRRSWLCASAGQPPYLEVLCGDVMRANRPVQGERTGAEGRPGRWNGLPRRRGSLGQHGVTDL
jgi:gamma-glutamyltranspeptidase/glutathione hydrolase